MAAIMGGASMGKSRGSVSVCTPEVLLTMTNNLTMSIHDTVSFHVNSRALCTASDSESRYFNSKMLKCNYGQVICPFMLR